MIDINLIRENEDLVKENIRKKFQNEKIIIVDKIKKLDEEWRKLKSKLDELRHERNKISEKINIAKKNDNQEEFNKLIKKVKELPKEIQDLEDKGRNLEDEIKQLMYKIPNIIHKSVPIGRDASENKIIKIIGKPKKIKFEIQNHAEFAERLEGADFDTARKISGNGFYFLRGKIAQLSVALINYARDYMIKQDFHYVEPPLMIRKRVVEGVMSFQEMENMMYKIDGEDLYLIGTSEHPLIGMFADKILNRKNIPYMITGFSPCFRKEVGAHGIEEKGFYRVHQFYKQEMIVICEQKDSYKFYNKMLDHTIKIFKSLKIPIRVLECCSGDLADLKTKSCDVEAWSSRQKKYFEVGSLTNMEEAQSRRLNIKISGENGNYFAHTLNNTVIATPRALIALIENHQQKDGSIKIPKVLHKYTGFKTIKNKN
jgi:seryl-tRNA synthetase